MTKADQKLRDKIERMLDLVSFKDRYGRRHHYRKLCATDDDNEELINKALKILWEEQ